MTCGEQGLIEATLEFNSKGRCLKAQETMAHLWEDQLALKACGTNIGGRGGRRGGEQFAYVKCRLDA